MPSVELAGLPERYKMNIWCMSHSASGERNGPNDVEVMRAIDLRDVCKRIWMRDTPHHADLSCRSLLSESNRRCSLLI